MIEIRVDSQNSEWDGHVVLGSLVFYIYFAFSSITNLLPVFS